MKKIFLILIIVLLVSLLMFALISCGNNSVRDNESDQNQSDPTNNEKKISSITVLGSPEIELNNFDIASYKILVTYDDSSSEEIVLENKYISTQDLDKLKEYGKHTIKITYLDNTFDWSITLLDPMEKYVVIDDSCGKFQLAGDKYYFSSYFGIDKDVIVPGTYKGKKVTKINSDAFYISNVENIIISENIEKIENCAIVSCLKLKSVSFPSTLTDMCSTSIEMSNKLENVEVNDNNPKYKSASNCIIDKTTSSLVFGCSSSVIPNDGSVKKINKNAFMYNNMTSIIIPSSVERIEDDAFLGCSSLCEIVNLSNLNIQKESENSFGLYAKEVYTSLDYTSKLVKENDYIIYKDNQESILVTYDGDDSSLVLPSVTSISEYAFLYNYNLLNVVLPDSLKRIEAGAFIGCDGLTSITIPKSVEYIGECAFEGCYALLEVCNLSKLDFVIGSTSNGSITEYAKYLYSSLDYESKIVIEDGYAIMVEDEEKTLLKYYGNNNSISIPEVTKISNNAFSMNSELISVTMPNAIKYIGDEAFSYCENLAYINLSTNLESIEKDAFQNCKSLEKITVPSSCKIIGDGAFSGCNHLKELILEDGVEKIEEDAFSYCRNLTKLVVPSSLKSIGDWAFSGCYSLCEIVDLSNLGIQKGVINNGLVGKFAKEIYSSIDYETKVIKENCYFIYNDGEERILLGYDGDDVSLILPDVTKINQYAFYNRGELENVVLPSTLKEIGDWAFHFCTNLQSIIIPSLVTKIGGDAFSGTSIYEIWNLSELDIKKGSYDFSSLLVLHASLEEESAVKIVNDFVIYQEDDKTVLAKYLGNETKITIPDVDIIGKKALLSTIYRITIKEIKIPSTVTSIEYGAFEQLIGLTSIEIPESVTSIGECAFYGCSGITNITIPSNVSSIGKSAFEGCYKLIEVCNKSSLPITVDSTENGYVGYYAKNVYTPNEGSSKLTIENGFVVFDSTTLVGYQGDSTELEIPSGIMTIYEKAFYRCSSLTSISIPDSVISIEKEAFYDCNRLKYNEYDNAYYLGNTVNPYLILIRAKDTSITTCVINDNTRFIYDGAFNWRSNLASIIIPNSVTTINGRIFYGCNGLTTIYCEASSKPVGWNSIWNEYCSADVVWGYQG